MAPVVEALRLEPGFQSKVCVTGQHRQMLDQTLALFDIKPDFDLNVMKEGQSLTDTSAAILSGMGHVLSEFRPDYLLIQGDTTTAMAAAIAAFYCKVKVGHVEAGLRTGDLFRPWPEEANRRVAGVVTHFHFAPTEAARQNLLREGVPAERVFVTGNTVVDALLTLVNRIEESPLMQFKCGSALPEGLDPKKRLVLVTGHRRESFDGGLENVFAAIAAIARRKDVQILYPVHLNPNVRRAASRILSGIENVFLTDPIDYLTFIYVMKRAYLIITDSGGIQEEAPILGKPLLITRTVTERPEAVLGGTGLLVGTDAKRIVLEAERLLDDPETYSAMSRVHNAFGDGRAAKYIVKELRNV